MGQMQCLMTALLSSFTYEIAEFANTFDPPKTHLLVEELPSTTYHGMGWAAKRCCRGKSESH